MGIEFCIGTLVGEISWILMGDFAEYLVAIV